jgi:hypothetical protein
MGRGWNLHFAQGELVVMTRFRIAMLSLLGLACGCQGLTPGQMEWVQPHSDQPRAGNVYLIRGLIGVFSTGMDGLAGHIEQQGIRARIFQDNQKDDLATAIIEKYKGVKNPEPLILVGHSYGADDVTRVAHALAKHNIKVDLAVTIDATTPWTVPPNVAVCYNYYQSQALDAIPLFRGIPLKEEKPGTVKLVNTDLRKDRTDLLQAGTNHINIDKNELLQSVIVKQVVEVCPTREVWVARHGLPTDPQRASAVIRTSGQGQ